MATTKYRPYLTLEEMEYILDTLSKSEQTNVTLARAIVANLTVAVFKIKLGDSRGSYKTNTIEDRLGMSTTSLDERRKLAYSQWILSPALCTQETIDLALTYGMENNLLTQEQEVQYLKSLSINESED